MSVETLLEKEFGVKCTFRENKETDVVNTSVTRIACNNPNRLGLIIINLSPNTIWIAPNPKVSPTLGIELSSNGGGISMIYRDDFILQSLEWFAVSDVDGSSIYVLEILEV